MVKDKNNAYPYKCYIVEPRLGCYGGKAIVGATDANHANELIRKFKELDTHNESDSNGYDYVDEYDVIEGVVSERDGILHYGIYYHG